MLFDFSGLFDNFITQIIMVLGFAGIVSMLVGAVTESWGKAIGVFFLCIIVIICVLLLRNAEAIGRFFKDQIWVGGEVASEPLKGIKDGIQLYKRI
ncbi:hypothetical protein [Carnobacterium maltaromaticum]|uniref:hypothetical protein n=1 Tax=Carnobacterium maltaromaticum TaxID=2751 RepID=UPI000705336B|nr:hypothetical protein [Carnobacterium maltaromaticum]AOA04028.1 hypothetical protein BFC23_16910 [Carnobacterium maltaromaticum]MBC9810544.1 hypothetical protein [Carnobacterium maltaromaticum]